MNTILPLSFGIVVSLLLGGCVHPKCAPTAGTLREVYQEDFLIGTAVNEAIVSGRDQAAQEIVRQQFNSITVENVMKAEPINPRPGVFDFGPADAFVAFGETNHMFIIGHTLVWHNQTPAWFFQDAQGQPRSR